MTEQITFSRLEIFRWLLEEPTVRMARTPYSNLLFMIDSSGIFRYYKDDKWRMYNYTNPVQGNYANDDEYGWTKVERKINRDQELEHWSTLASFFTSSRQAIEISHILTP